LTQGQLAHDLSVSQNYIPAIKSNARQAGPKVQQQLVKYFGCRLGDQGVDAGSASACPQ